MSETTSKARCGACDNTASDAGKTLKSCAKCHSVRYCDRDCQKKDWKQHKKICASNAAENATTTAPSANRQPLHSGASETLTSNPFAALSEKTFLHNRSEEETFKVLIDSFRMRQEDEYMYGDVDEDSIYAGAPNSVKPFRRFLAQAEKMRGLLPPWWSKQKTQECVAYGKSGNDWADLKCCVEKHDIQEHYGSPLAPMQLRMLAEQITGTGVSAF